MDLLRRLRLTDLTKFRYLSTQSPNTKSNERSLAWQSVIGLEIHAQIQSNCKLFSGAGAKFAAPINSQVSFFDAALPGTLPVLNKQCVQAAVLTALALGCRINSVSRFDRKHYFYADLPSGYQITQQRQPLGVKGCVPYLVAEMIPGKGRKFEHRTARITQLQLEQDSGKSLHDAEDGISLIDLNRAGVGLMEIVTEPDFTSAEEAAAFVKELQSILQTLGTCDGKMSEGSMRVDASISLHRPNEPLGVRAEVKNINSIRNVAKAIEYEIKRQAEILDSGGEIANETRAFDHETSTTVSMRDKERLHDYRFLPEPNLPPLRVYTNDILASLPDERIPPRDQIVNIDVLRTDLTDLPKVKREKLCDNYGLSLEHAAVIVGEPDMEPLFRKLMLKDRNPKRAANFLQNEVLALLNKDDKIFSESSVNRFLMARFGWIKKPNYGGEGDSAMRLFHQVPAHLSEQGTDEIAAWIKISLLVKGLTFSAGSIDEFIKIIISHLNEENVGEILDLLEKGTISTSTAKKVLECVYQGDPAPPSQIVRVNRWSQVTDPAQLGRICQLVIEKNPDTEAAYRKGKTKVINALIGQVQKETQGRADAVKVKEIMTQKLKS